MISFVTWCSVLASQLGYSAAAAAAPIISSASPSGSQCSGACSGASVVELVECSGASVVELVECSGACREEDRVLRRFSRLARANWVVRARDGREQ